MRDQLARILPVSEREMEKNSYPMFDQLIFLDTDAENILKRVGGIQVDPTTGHIYDPVINPPPEADKKLMARLEPFQVEEEDLRSRIAQFEEHAHSLSAFMERFGFEEIPVPVFNVVDSTAAVADTVEHIVRNVKPIVTLKYELYASEVLPATYRNLVPDEHASENHPDVSEKVDSQKHYEGQISLQPNFQSPQVARVSTRDIFGPTTTPQVSQSRLIKRNSFYSASKGSFRKLDTMSMRSGSNRREKMLAYSVESWEKIFVDYTDNVEKNLKEAKDIFHILDVHYENSQKFFAKIFREKREFHGPLISFVDSYRRFLADNPEVIKDEYCKRKLYSKIDSIHDQLWLEIEKSREKAIEDKDKMITKNLITADIQSLCKINLSLVAGEMNKLFHLR